MPVIVVNATALEQSGGLAVLKQFVESVPANGFEYIVFVSDKVSITSELPAVRIIPVHGVKSFRKRMLWDLFGVKRWLKRHHITPYASLSLQNTNFRTGCHIPNYIYYHQSIPFTREKWSPFKREQRVLWFYKKIYPFFVRWLLNQQTEIFVQLSVIKAQFAAYFHFPESRIHVISPYIKLWNEGKTRNRLSSDKLNLFYPATPFFYKNHSVLAKALSKTKNQDCLLYLTCKPDELPGLADLPNVRCGGPLLPEKMWGMYEEADALLFPSYIETYGLPLIEAASTGMPVLVADLPYAREVLEGYEGAVFIDYADPQAWAEEIDKLKKGVRYPPLKMSQKQSWPKLFQIINK